MCGLIVLELEDVLFHEGVPLNRHMKFSSGFLAAGPTAAPRQVVCSISLMLGLPLQSRVRREWRAFQRGGELPGVSSPLEGSGSAKDLKATRATLYFCAVKVSLLPADDTKFLEAIQTLLTWIERGEVNRRTANNFYSMIQSANSHIRRLVNEKAAHEKEMEEAKEKFKLALSGILVQCE